jgi:hypothetical protein
VPKSDRITALTLIAISLVLLMPGIFLPVLTIRGMLTKEGVAYVAPVMLEKGLNDETMKTLSSLINPQMIAMMKALGGDLRKMIIEKLGPQLSAALQQGVENVEVYQQTRSITGAVRQLYNVGSPLPATLILLFSVIVPLTKAALVAMAVFMRNTALRLRTVKFVELIAKWSMADVFAVALFIVFLAAQATQQAPGAPEAAPPLLAFTAHFGPGFYWFTGYCIFSLASQQYTRRLALRSQGVTP